MQLRERLLIPFVLSYLLTISSSNADTTAFRQTADSRPSTDKIQFEMADFELQYNISGTTALLQAYRVHMKNVDDEPKEFVSVGYPTLTTNQRNQTLQRDPEDVSIYVKTLDNFQQYALFEKARDKYQLDDDLSASDVIRPMPLARFSCVMNFYNDGRLYTVYGVVNDLQKDPLEVTFPMMAGSNNRIAFERRLLKQRRLKFFCELIATGKQEHTASLTILSEELQRLNLPAKLFGTRNNTYLSLPQMKKLSQEVMTSLRIQEYYDSEAETFGESYIAEMLKLSHSNFQSVSVESGLRGLSGYGLTVDKETLQPQSIKALLQQQFQIETIDQKKIVTAVDDDAQRPSSTNVSAVVLDILDVPADKLFVKLQRQNWMDQNKSIDQQLAEWSGRPGGNVRYECKDNRIVPAMLQLLAIDRADFGRNIKLDRIRRKPKDVLLRKKYQLELDTVNLLSILESTPSISSLTGSLSLQVKRIIDEKIQVKLREIGSFLDFREECRTVNGTGFGNLYSESLFLTSQTFVAISNQQLNCSSPPKTHLTLNANQNQPYFTYKLTCATAKTFREETANISQTPGAYYNAISAESLSRLGVRCDNNENLKEFKFNRAEIPGGIKIWTTAKCCKMTVVSVQESNNG